jgi:hypothetical protein
METTKNKTQIGKNILLFENENVVLQKTNRSKSVLAFWTTLLLLTILGTIYFILKDNQPLHWPPTLGGRILLPFVVGGILFLIFRILRSTVNEWKDYVLATDGHNVIVNGSHFGELSQTEIVIKEKVGHEGIGVAYEVQLKHKRKKLILSFGNRLGEAKEVATLLGGRLGLTTRVALSS